MRFSLALAAAVAAPLVAAAPVIQKRALSANDTNTLQLALYLEHLEFNLYSGGYANFSDAQYAADGFPPGFRENVGVIAQVKKQSLVPSICAPNSLLFASTNKLM